MKRRFSSAELFELRNSIPINAVIKDLLLMGSKTIDGYFRFLCPVCNEFQTATKVSTNLVPIVFAGLPKVRTYLASQHPDILSRLKTLVLYPIEGEDFILEYKDFIPEAVEQIYAATKGDMRKFEEIITDCRQRARQLKYVFVDVNLVLSFLAEQPGV
jgi:hypothetical protein